MILCCSRAGKFLAICAATAGFCRAAVADERIAAYGRVSPGERAITVALPYFSGAPQLVKDLLVKEGEPVTRGQRLAVTDNEALAAADLEAARSHLAAAQEKIKALSAGPKGEELAAQEQTVKSLEADLKAERARKHPDSGAGRDEAAAHEESLEARAAAAQHQLAALKTPDPGELAVAQAQVHEAEAGVARAEALASQTAVEAPIDGQILRILTFPGEGGAGRGLLELADTHAMVVKAELNAADAYRVKVGAHATIKGDAWFGEMSGAVERISPRVERSTLTALSTFANVDRQVVEATIVPETPEKLAGHTGAEATVLINVEPLAK